MQRADVPETMTDLRAVEAGGRRLEVMDLVFVYNAKGGKVSALLDMGHKIISPDSYQCNLCSLTHGNFTEKKEWADFRKSSPIDMAFLHSDEFEKEYGRGYTYPIVLKRDGGLEVLISTEELNGITTPADLIEMVRVRAT